MSGTDFAAGLFISRGHSIICTALKKTLGHLQLKGSNTKSGRRSLLCSNLSSLEDHLLKFPVRGRFSEVFGLKTIERNLELYFTKGAFPPERHQMV